jgi:hypothetical protein
LVLLVVLLVVRMSWEVKRFQWVEGPVPLGLMLFLRGLRWDVVSWSLVEVGESGSKDLKESLSEDG